MCRSLVKRAVLTAAVLGMALIPALPATAVPFWIPPPTVTPDQCAGMTVPSVWTPPECKTTQQKQDDACNKYGGGLIGNYCRELVSDPKNPFAEVNAGIKTLVSNQTRDKVGDGTGLVAEWVIEKTSGVFASLEKTTAPDLRAGWFVEQYRTNAGIAIGMSLLLALFALLIGLKRRSAKEIAGSVGGIIEFAVLIGLIPWGVIGGLVLIDWITHTMLVHSGDNVRTFFQAVSNSTAGTPALKELGAFFAAILVAIGMFCVWAALTAREALIYLSVVLGALVAVMTILPDGGKWTKRLVGWLATLGFMKILVIGAISLAFSLLGGIKTGRIGIDDLAWSGFFLAGAGISPLWLPHLAPWAGAIVASRALSSHRQVTAPLNSGRKHVQNRLLGWNNQSARSNGSRSSQNGTPITIASTARDARARWQNRMRHMNVTGTPPVEVPLRRTPVETDVPKTVKPLAVKSVVYPMPSNYRGAGLPTRGSGGTSGTRPRDYRGGKRDDGR